MDRNPETRLGSSESDSMEIRNHPFFADMDWSALVEQQLTAPYIPEINTADQEAPQNDQEQLNVQSDIQAQDAFEQMPESQIAYIRENQDQFKGF